ncbi:hypothetical protein FHL15_010308 [Xylaria flabelliformis]|uniref:PD-(D/E)XK nuclease-like domain-containing protein n=1 Tax=Xylaria flabelliformis TaxID=2512241 RepID=A0A553HLM0_9PEZI|nr:hypothetical protein FHL15_010308 [Xylaria flabelliformis]
MSWESVDEWLCHIINTNAECDTPVIADTRTPPQKTSRKRGLVSPPMSTAPNKKKRREQRVLIPTLLHQTIGSDDDADVSQETPRATKRPKSDNTPLASMSHTPSLHSDRTCSSAWSDKSGRSSPTKQIAKLRINASMQHRMMDDDGSEDFPESLRRLLDPIKRATTLCRGLLFESQRQEIRDYAQVDPTHRRNFRECSEDDLLFSDTFADRFDPSRLREYERRLDPEFVGFILDEARECDENLHPEASWNMLVHYPLMRRAIMGSSRRRNVDDDGDPLVTVVPCTTATLIADFKVHDAPAHKVDFAIALEPGGTAANRKTIANAIEARRESMPWWSINHTDYSPLLNRPIAISVETKRTNDDFEKARVQLMVWLAAQWVKLESMTDRPPNILPAIIIQGHDWYLVVSTRADDGKKVTYSLI